MLPNARKLLVVNKSTVCVEGVGAGLVHRAGMSWVAPVGSWIMRWGSPRFRRRSMIGKVCPQSG